ncbi:hypothetical protein [Halorussus halobius]|uniref:hypothetical protein n=1 Tax=Halorussus halobius TaxID=1710537 RepID=UPI0010918D49|nr:hypothetical protein [Halorussus halobius]
MRLAFVLVVVGVALVAGTGVATATTDQQTPPPWPGDGPPGNDSATANGSASAPPGQQLAGAVGAQGASVEGELWNRTLTDRLADAGTPGERAGVLAEETDTLAAYLGVLEGVKSNVTGARAAGEMGDGEYRATLSAFVVRAHTVELRANRTARAARNLSVVARERHDVNVTRVRNVSERARDLYRFEDELGREVVNETLTDERALTGMAVETDESNRTADADGATEDSRAGQGPASRVSGPG